MLCVIWGSLYVNTQGYVPALLENLCGMSALKLTGFWVVVGFTVVMEAFLWSLITLCSM